MKNKTKKKTKNKKIAPKNLQKEHGQGAKLQNHRGANNSSDVPTQNKATTEHKQT
jgi:hypothetical protein